MAESMDLLEWARTRARSTDPDTSHSAARQARALAGEHQRMILAALNAGEGTAEDVALRCGLQTHQCNRRVGELISAGLIELTGETRVNSNGRRMRVFRRVGGG